MSINMHALVRGVINTINSDITATLKRNTGYTTGPSGKQVPTYATVTENGNAQVQALGASELRHMNDLNIQGVMRKVYLYGDWGGPVRADAVGGDLLTFPRIRGGAAVDWKIVTVFETWTDSDWCAVGVVLQ